MSFKHILVLLAILLFFLGGCKTSGHRRITVGFTGPTIVLEDETFNDDQGEQKYAASFDDGGWSLLDLLFRPQPQEDPNKDGSGDSPDGG